MTLMNSLSIGLSQLLLYSMGLFVLELTISLAGAGDADLSTKSKALISLGRQTAHFVDEKFIASKSGAKLKLHPPQKRGEQLLVSDRAWENATLNWMSLLKVGDTWRMWYECYDVAGWPTADDTSFCYAESHDGVHFTKPNLQQFDYQGSRDNNILFRLVGNGNHRSRVHGTCVFIDESAPTSERYKAVSQGQFQGIGNRPYYVAGMTSPDGKTWQRLERPICLDFADSQYSAFWDPSHKEYALFGRTAGRGGRAIGRSVSRRFETFDSLSKSTVLEVTPNDPQACDLYNPACQLYPGTSGLYVMFPSFFRHKEDTLEIRIAFSRDGINWTWPDRETPWIALGPADMFDGGSLYFVNGGCVATTTEFSYYFTGSRLKHAEVDLPQLSDPKNRRLLSRATGPTDRMVSISANEKGHLTTPLLTFQGNRLKFNACVQPQGSIRVGVIDNKGNPVSGRSLVDCTPITGDSLSHTVTWGSNTDVSDLEDQPVTLEIELQLADLFCFRFEE